jgi:hypothetical protein
LSKGRSRPVKGYTESGKALGTEEQTKARGTEDNCSSLFLWLLSVPLYPSLFVFADPALGGFWCEADSFSGFGITDLADSLVDEG